MECPECHHLLSHPSAFCVGCGAALFSLLGALPLPPPFHEPPLPCSSCFRENDPIARFCLDCGIPLRDASIVPRLSSSAPLETGDERRTVTILHADLCGFTRLVERFDPEQTRSLIDALFRQLAREIEAWGGAVDSYVGDAILAVFGAASGASDAPWRAIRAARGLHRVLERFTHPLLSPMSGRLHMRVGIDTGPVVVGRIGALRRTTVTGATVAAAIELERASRPGGVLLGESTRRLLAEGSLLSARLLPSGRVAYELRGAEEETFERESPSAGVLVIVEDDDASEGSGAITAPPRVALATSDVGATAGSECYHCGRLNPHRARFCGACGRGLEVPHCVACDSLLAPGARFCGRCGALAVEDLLTGVPEEQLRQVTVLFALVTDLHEPATHLDPEDFKDLLDGCFRMLSAEVAARGGAIDKYMADSLMALFGVPAAHEDDPDRAVAAALGMLDALEAFNRRLFSTRGFQLGLKIGINTGKVLVGHVGAGNQPLTVMGDVVNTASRVEHAAPVNGILVCDSTRRGLGDRYTLRLQPPLIVKGKERPLVVYRVLRASTGTAMAKLDLFHLPLVGREREFEVLASCWREVVRPIEGSGGRSGAWVTLIGDVGLGTDRLLREFQGYTALDPCQPRIHVTRGLSFATGSGAEVLRRLIESLADIEPGEEADISASKLTALSQKIAGFDPESGETIRAELVARSLARLAGLRLPEGPSERLGALAPRRTREQGIAYLLSLCARLALERPLIIIASELQWAEEAALDFFETLGAAAPQRVMLITAARQTLLEKRQTWGQGSAVHRLVTLRPLDLRDTKALTRAITGEENLLPPALVEALHRFTGGNPFYLTEALRYLLEARGSGAQAADVEALVVPDSIEGVLQSRLDRLSFEEGLTLRAAAVIGPTFWRGALAAVVGRDPGEALEQLRARGFIQRGINASIPGEEEFTFEHVLTARVAAGNLLESVRRRYHQAIARWMVERSTRSITLDLSIAHHFEAAGMGGEASPWFGWAADRLLAAYECAEAIELYGRALSTLGGNVPEGLAPQRDRRGEGAATFMSSSGCSYAEIARRRIHFLARRGEARRMLNELQPALEDFLEAASTAVEVGQILEAAACWYQAGLVYLALGAIVPAERAADTGDRLLDGHRATTVTAIGLQLRGELHLQGGRRSEARQALEQAMAEWRRLGDRWGLAYCLHVTGSLLMSQSDFTAAQRAFREASSLREALGDSYGLANSLHNLGAVSDCLGRFSEALGFYHRSLRLHRRLGNRPGQAGTLMNQGVGYLRCGYFGRARASLEEALELHKQLERPWGIGACQGNLGHFWVQLGRLREAGSYLTEAVVCLRSMGDVEALSEVLIDLATCRLEERLLDEAERLGQEAFELVRGRAGVPAEALALLLLGRVALARSALEDAWRFVEESEWNEAVQATPQLGMQVAMLAGYVALESGRTSSAATRFEEAERIARAHDLAPGLWEARSMRHLALARSGADRVAASVASAAQEAFRELLARVEDPELVAIVQSRAAR